MKTTNTLFYLLIFFFLSGITLLWLLCVSIFFCLKRTMVEDVLAYRNLNSMVTNYIVNKKKTKQLQSDLVRCMNKLIVLQKHYIRLQKKYNMQMHNFDALQGMAINHRDCRRLVFCKECHRLCPEASRPKSSHPFDYLCEMCVNRIYYKLIRPEEHQRDTSPRTDRSLRQTRRDDSTAASSPCSRAPIESGSRLLSAP